MRNHLWWIILVALAVVTGALASVTARSDAAPTAVEQNLRAQLKLERHRHNADMKQLKKRYSSLQREHSALKHSPKVTEWIDMAADLYNLPRQGMRNIAWCESNWTPNVVNRTPIWNGEHAGGLFQFIPSTWIQQTTLGRKGWSRLNGLANALSAAELISRDGTRQWHCKMDGRPHG